MFKKPFTHSTMGRLKVFNSAGDYEPDPSMLLLLIDNCNRRARLSSLLRSSSSFSLSGPQILNFIYFFLNDVIAGTKFEIESLDISELRYILFWNIIQSRLFHQGILALLYIPNHPNFPYIVGTRSKATHMRSTTQLMSFSWIRSR